MKPQETAQSYDKIASHWNSGDFNRDNGLEQHRRALQFLRKKETGLDVGCGSSGRFIEMLISEGFEIEGVDVSPEMLRLAKERHPDVTFHLADICEWDLPGKYDFISAWDSIWHVPLEDQESVLTKLLTGLADGGVMIFSSGGVDTAGESSNPCFGQPLYHAAPGIPRLLEIISECGCVCRHLEYDQFPEKHLYLIVQKSDKLEEAE